MSVQELFCGPNVAFLLDLYAQYLEDRTSVAEIDRALLEELEQSGQLSPQALLQPAMPSATGPAAPAGPPVGHVVAAARLARSIREYGHLAAKLDPLGSPPLGDPALSPQAHGIDDRVLAGLPAEVVRPLVPGPVANCAEAVARLREIYCATVGYDFRHVHDYVEREWLRETVESGTYQAPLSLERRRELLYRLTEVEELERFLHRTFQGQKRFSIEGVDVLVPMLDTLVAEAAASGVREIQFGMAHRGRLNVLAHVFGKPYAALYAEFTGVAEDAEIDTSHGWTGDVKYHLGGRRTIYNGDLLEVQLTLANNPSHLEFVDPVVSGLTRACQDDRSAPGTPVQDTGRALSVLMHGDAAFMGEGIVAETLNLSRLPGYSGGGTVHVISNNQLGFTTLPPAGRSTLYASDLAKGFEIPIIHVNADDPEASVAAIRIAFAYRQRFHKDFLVDLVGYRRWGHNEGDEPAFTQPIMYEKIRSHSTVRAVYAETLVAAGVVSKDEVANMVSEVDSRLKAAHTPEQENAALPVPPTYDEDPESVSLDTAVSEDRLRNLNARLLARPSEFTPHARLAKLLARREPALDKPGGIDWGHAEALALASMLEDGVAIRMAGQDTQRGTFSQRHLVLHDARSGEEYVPLGALPEARAAFSAYNSSLSEAAALGFEYGYSLHAPHTLVIWEAQFGDFANAGQVLIDQFVVSGRAKWRQRSSLVLLLPHGYEGQGPEHSSARPERYLQMAAEDNLRVANCTTAAQYFHLLRRQAALIERRPRPLVLFTPKSLLRHPLAGCSLADLAYGTFEPVLDDPAAKENPTAVERVVLCTGKIGIEYLAQVAQTEGAGKRNALIRIEELYPFPSQKVVDMFSRYPKVREVVWMQEEPQNMGAFAHVAPRLEPLLPRHVALGYIGAPARAAPAEGAASVHAAEQARILQEALATTRQPVELKARGGKRSGD